jgi:hypothetical protein
VGWRVRVVHLQAHWQYDASAMLAGSVRRSSIVEVRLARRAEPTPLVGIFTAAECFLSGRRTT